MLYKTVFVLLCHSAASHSWIS